MANQEKALSRVAQLLDLSRSEKQEFIDIAQRISTEIETPFYSYNEEHLQHLNQDVFSPRRGSELPQIDPQHRQLVRKNLGD